MFVVVRINGTSTPVSRLILGRLLQRHFLYVDLPPTRIAEIALSRMTSTLAAILHPLLYSSSKSSMLWVIKRVEIDSSGSRF